MLARKHDQEGRPTAAKSYEISAWCYSNSDYKSFRKNRKGVPLMRLLGVGGKQKPFT